MAVHLVERHQGVALPSDRHDDLVFIEQGARSVAVNQRAGIIFQPQIVHPCDFACLRIQAVNFPGDTRGVQPVAIHQRRSVRTGPDLRVVGEHRAIGVLPHGFARLGIDRHNQFLFTALPTVSPIMHGVQAAAVNYNSRESLAQFPDPQPLRTAGRPRVGKPRGIHLEVPVRPAPLGPLRKHQQKDSRIH